MPNFPLKYKNSLDILYEDIYFFDETGDVISSRCANNTQISNIFELFSKEEELFIREGIKSYELRPFILAESRVGLIFIARSFFPDFRVLLAIVPHFGRDEILAIAQRAVPAGVCPTNACAEALGSAKIADMELKDEHIAFGKRISDVFCKIKFYRSESLSNMEIVDFASDKILSFSSLFGCTVNISFDRSIFDIRPVGRFSMELFLFALVCFCFASRKYSVDHALNITLFGHEIAPYCEASFKICPERGGTERFKNASELSIFETVRSSQHCFVYDFSVLNDSFSARWIPWERDPALIGLKTRAQLKGLDDLNNKYSKTERVLKYFEKIFDDRGGRI